MSPVSVFRSSPCVDPSRGATIQRGPRSLDSPIPASREIPLPQSPASQLAEVTSSVASWCPWQGIPAGGPVPGLGPQESRKGACFFPHFLQLVPNGVPPPPSLGRSWLRRHQGAAGPVSPRAVGWSCLDSNQHRSVNFGTWKEVATSHGARG